MKNLILIGGTMGVGKTTVSKELQKILPRNVFLDGDWCWAAEPFTVNDETKEMVMENITYLLGQFLRCSAYENVIFCWVMHQRGILDSILRRLETRGWQVCAVALVCSPEALSRRHAADAAAGKRGVGSLERALAYLPLYAGLGVPQLDTSQIGPADAAERIIRMAAG